MAAALLTVMLLVFVLSAAASRQLEEDAMLGSLAPAPAPLRGSPRRGLGRRSRCLAPRLPRSVRTSGGALFFF
jgi:hypothetical protein